MSDEMTSWTFDPNDYVFEQKGEIYRNGWAALEKARTIPDNILGPDFNIHFYWRVGNPFERKQAIAIKSAIVTQLRKGVHIHLWSNVDLSSNEWLKPMLPYINLHKYDPVLLAVGSPVEGKNRLLNVTDHLSWLDGDLFRLLVLYRYGGVYVDMDCILLRSLDPLIGVEFMYQWGTELDKINGAVMRMAPGSLLGKILLGFLPHVPACYASTDWGSSLYGAVRQVYKNWIVFPCMFFNSEWQVGFNMSDSAHPFRASEQSKELFDGAFVWHWHNKWDAPIEPGSKFDILERRVNQMWEDTFKC